MPDFILKDPKSENDKFKPVSKIVFPFINLRNLVILKKNEGAWFSLFNKF